MMSISLFSSSLWMLALRISNPPPFQNKIPLPLWYMYMRNEIIGCEWWNSLYTSAIFDINHTFYTTSFIVYDKYADLINCSLQACSSRSEEIRMDVQVVYPNFFSDWQLQNHHRPKKENNVCYSLHNKMFFFIDSLIGIWGCRHCRKKYIIHVIGKITFNVYVYISFLS